MVSLNPMSVNIQTIILGNIGDCAGRYSATGDHRRGFADHSVFEVERSDGGLFDENHARSIGLNPGRLKLLFYAALRFHDRRTANRRRLSGDLHGGYARCDGGC